MTLDEEFGEFPGRPDHPDLKALSDIVISMDGQAEVLSLTGESTEEFFQRRFKEAGIDEKAISWMAQQRALMASGVLSDTPFGPFQELLGELLAAVWIEAALVGIAFEQHKHPDT